jgi:hypothetical protein
MARMTVCVLTWQRAAISAGRYIGVKFSVMPLKPPASRRWPRDFTTD